MKPALIVCLGWTAACGAAAPPPTAGPLRVRTVAATTGPLTDEVPVAAVLEAARWQPLYFQQGGVVASVAVPEGAPVRAGQTLAALDTASQRNRVAQADLELKAAIRDHARAVHELDGVRAMAAAEAASPEALYEAEQRVIEADARVEQARLRLEAERIKLSQMALSAPFDGVLVEANLRVGDRVQGEAADPDSAEGRRPPMECPGGRVLSEAVVARMQEDRIATWGGEASLGDFEYSMEGYGMGWWIDRDQPGLISDPGIFGATPWIDGPRGYGAMVMVEGSVDLGEVFLARLVPLAAAAVDGAALDAR